MTGGIAQEYELRGKKYRGLEHVLSFGGRIAHEHRPFAIGRFGWGLSQTASSLSERTEVYTRTANDANWRYSYYDYQELSEDEDCFVPSETLRDPPYIAQTLSGTVVILDDIKSDEFKQTTRMANMFKREFGRVYRKFISSGGSIKIIVEQEGKKAKNFDVEISDPLMILPGSREYQKLGGPSKSYGTSVITLDGTSGLPEIINKRTNGFSQIRINLARIDVELVRKYVENQGLTVQTSDAAEIETWGLECEIRVLPHSKWKRN